MTDNPTIAASFDAVARRYDGERRRLIPCFDRFYGTALALLPPAPGRVLDLGAGTGLFAGLVASRSPKAALTLVDVAAAMLEQAERSLAGHPGGFATRVADYASADLDGPWDAIVSALSIHHLEDAAKAALFRRIRDALVPGGIFVNAEQVAAPTPALQPEYDRIWADEAAAAGATASEIAAARERMRHDRCAPIAAQLDWMREAGLADVDCRFKDGCFAVLHGRRPLSGGSRR